MLIKPLALVPRPNMSGAETLHLTIRARTVTFFFFVLGRFARVVTDARNVRPKARSCEALEQGSVSALLIGRFLYAQSCSRLHLFDHHSDTPQQRSTLLLPLFLKCSIWSNFTLYGSFVWLLWMTVPRCLLYAKTTVNAVHQQKGDSAHSGQKAPQRG
jgi:hypothetical protein